jgi:hypothetical protein
VINKLGDYIYKNEFSSSVQNYIYGDYFPQLLYKFVKWLIDDAVRKNIETLYFLSRDAYIFMEVAKLICKKSNIKIELKYLYCSRISLRTPILWMINEDEAMDYIFSISTNVTLNKILNRTFILRNDICKICNELNINEEDRNILLSKKQVSYYKKIFSENRNFKEKLFTQSKQKYNNIAKYFLQEGLFSNKKFAIVDSGWTGSIQKNISTILKKDVDVGYYYGLYDLPDYYKSNYYFSYYFSPNNNILRKVFFNNNIFEYLCSAPHPMTIGYKKIDDKYIPLFEQVNSENYEKINENICKLVNAVDLLLNNETTVNSIEIEFFKKIMIFPDTRIINFFKNGMFSDDMNESRDSKLICNLTNKEIRKNFILNKLFRKIKDDFVKESLWIEGEIGLQRNKKILIKRYIFYKVVKYTKQVIINIVKGIKCR